MRWIGTKPAQDTRRVVAECSRPPERVVEVHTFGKGLGIAAPQTGIDRAAAIVRPPGGDTITLLNSRIVEESAETDEQDEGRLSFFDVRGMVPRPLVVHVEHHDVDGQRRITVFERGIGRLVAQAPLRPYPMAVVSAIRPRCSREIPPVAAADPHPDDAGRLWFLVHRWAFAPLGRVHNLLA